MAKSLRSKAKRKARIIKRTDSHYAVADAERVQRLHERLTGKGKAKEEEGDEEEVEGEGAQEEVDGEVKMEDGEAMQTDEPKISTSGPRNSRREQWRVSKGMPARPKREGVNRQGQAKGKRKPGRPARRR